MVINCNYEKHIQILSSLLCYENDPPIPADFIIGHGPMKEMFPGGYCRYHPTCSEYGYQSIEKFGLVKGGVKTVWRILRCNPFSKGGNDPVK